MSVHPHHLYLCVSEVQDGQPFEYLFSLVTGNVQEVHSLRQHQLIFPSIGHQEWGERVPTYHMSVLIDSAQRVLTLIQLAELKEDHLAVRNILEGFDPEEHDFGIFDWWRWALVTLVWENRTGWLLEFGWEFDLDIVEHAAEKFTYSRIVAGDIAEEFGVDPTLVFDMKSYSQSEARWREIGDPIQASRDESC